MDDIGNLSALRRLGPPEDDELPPIVRSCNVACPPPEFDDFLNGAAQVLLPFAEPARIHRYCADQSRWEAKDVTVVVCTKPFSRGAMRSSFYCVNAQHPDTLLVAKLYRKRRHSTMEQTFADARMHHVANHWASMFNNYGPPKRVRFLPACAMELRGRTPSVWVGVEPYMRGTYRKHNNNNGYVSRSPAARPAVAPAPDAPPLPQPARGSPEEMLPPVMQEENAGDRKKPTAAETRCTPQAFLHFSHHFSGGNIMVCDIQGVGDVYTDPQILTPDGEGHGRGNIGKRGIERCLRNHVCNAVCRRLGLPPLVDGVPQESRNPLPKREVPVYQSGAADRPERAASPELREVRGSPAAKSSGGPSPAGPAVTPPPLQGPSERAFNMSGSLKDTPALGPMASPKFDLSATGTALALGASPKAVQRHRPGPGSPLERLRRIFAPIFSRAEAASSPVPLAAPLDAPASPVAELRPPVAGPGVRPKNVPRS